MSCCTVEGTAKFFTRNARVAMKRFRKKGLDRAQTVILHGLKQLGFEGKTVMDIGCGVGGLHLTLLQQGMTSAVGVDLSDGMIEGARELAAELRLGGRTKYHVADFATAADSFERSDVVILDKVLCCYEDPGGLIEKSVGKTVHLYAVSYPRNSILAKSSFKFSGLIARLLRQSFQPLYHDTAMLEDTITRQGMEERFSGTTPIWQVKVYGWRGSGEAHRLFQ